MKKEDFITLNRQGFIPGPSEKKEDFFKRVNLTKELYFKKKGFFSEKKIPIPFPLENKIKKPDFNWPRSCLLNLFDISSVFALAYYSNYKLYFFQGAATWFLDIDKIFVPILQIRKKRKFLSFDVDDILAHEMVHFARSAFSENKYEEFFAYLTSGSVLRKIFGPIVISKKEIFLFFILIGVSSVFSLFSSFLYFFMSFCLGLFLFLGFVRLGKKRIIFKSCFKKLKKITKEKKKSFYIMFRLTDAEIEYFAKNSKQDILSYIDKNKSYRWKMIKECYF